MRAGARARPRRAAMGGVRVHAAQRRGGRADGGGPSVVASRDTCIREATNALRSGRVPGDALTVRHIMVDEAQDNDLEQFELLDALLEFMTQHWMCAVVTIVGDSRQAIYAFRGGASTPLSPRATGIRRGHAYRQPCCRKTFGRPPDHRGVQRAVPSPPTCCPCARSTSTACARRCAPSRRRATSAPRCGRCRSTSPAGCSRAPS